MNIKNLNLLAIYSLCFVTVTIQASVLRNYYYNTKAQVVNRTLNDHNIGSKNYTLPQWSIKNFKQSLISPWTLPVLRHINLYRNQYTQFDVSPLTVLPIERFVIRQNRIVDVTDCFVDFKELRILDFQDNMINRFIVTENPPEPVSSKLSTVWFNDNEITSVPNLNLFGNLTLGDLQVVELFDNPFSCNCRDSQWIIDSPDHWGRIFQGECGSPPLLVGQPINLMCISFDRNTIRYSNGTEQKIQKSVLSRVMDTLHFW